MTTPSALMRSTTLLFGTLGNPVNLNVTDLHVNSILTLGLGKTTYTVFDVCVTDPPWPSGGVPVSVALFALHPGSANVWWQKYVVDLPGASGSLGPPVIASQFSSVKLLSVSLVLPASLTMIS